MESLEKLNKLRNNILLLFFFMSVVTVVLSGMLKFVSAVIGIALLIIGNVLNFMYIKKLRQAQKK